MSVVTNECFSNIWESVPLFRMWTILVLVLESVDLLSMIRRVFTFHRREWMNTNPQLAQHANLHSTNFTLQNTKFSSSSFVEALGSCQAIARYLGLFPCASPLHNIWRKRHHNHRYILPLIPSWTGTTAAHIFRNFVYDMDPDTSWWFHGCSRFRTARILYPLSSVEFAFCI